IEAFIPWVTFGLTEDPESMMMDGAVMYCPTYNGKREAWVSLAANKRPAYSWENPQAWYRFDSEGWVDDENFDGHWVYTGYEKDVIISDDDKVVEIFNTEDAWNYPSPRFVQANGIYENSVYHQAKFFAPSVYNNELIEYETNPNEETVLSGLWISRGGRIQLDLQYNQGGWYLRFSGPWWTTISLTEAQADLLKNKDKGLTVGLYVEGDTAIAYLDDGTGLMEQAIVLDITSKSNGYDKTKLFTAGVHAQCDSIIKDHLIFGNIVNVPYVINDGEPLVGGNVQVTGTMASSKVTVIPSAGYALDKLIVHGIKVNKLVYNSTAPILNIQVSFKEVVGKQVDVTVKGGFAYEQAKTLNGVAVTFTDGTDSYFGIVGDDGKASITLPVGSYTVKAIGYTDATIVIDSETAYELTLNRIIVDNIDYGTVIPSTNILYDNGGADGANILYDGGIKNPDNPTGDADEARFTLNQGLDLSGPVVVSYTMKVATRIRAFIPIEFNKSYMCNFGIWDNSTIVIKKYNQNPSIATVGKISTDYGVECVSIGITAIIDGSNAIMLYTDGEGNTHYIDTLTNNTPITSINFRFADFGGVMAIEDLKVYDGQSAQNIVDNYGATITVGEKGNSTVTCDNSIDFTESKNIT
ncbi:MAG: hypothetical protein J6R83_02200, partial [Clostridia bacterium]|nr:hypothetical protein [Clostridia bacterium]